MEQISIIIPTRNEFKNLSILLPLIRKQKDIEADIIIADAGSLDGTKKLAKKYNAKIVEGGRKPTVGRNNGAKVAKYERIVFFDADVNFSEDFLIYCITYMKKKNWDSATVRTNPDSNRLDDAFLFGLWDLWIWFTQKFFPHAPGYCIFSRKSINKKIKGWDETVILADDSNYVLRASKVGRFGLIPIKITTSVRRLDTEGRFTMVRKMVACGIYRMFGKEDRTNKFDYNFNKHKSKK